MTVLFGRAAAGLAAFSVMFCGSVVGQEWKSGVEFSEPPIVAPGTEPGAPPSDAIVLFDGTDLSAWEGGDRWLVEEGCAIPKNGGIRTKQAFGDIQLHIEWATPAEVKGSGQGRGNSGVFLMDTYEVQVLDSYDNTTYFDGQAAAIYKQTPPMANVMRGPGEWNTYDIFFTAPRFRVNGDIQTPAYVTVVHNGVLVQNHFEILGPTNFTEAPHYIAHAEKMPISLQDHGNPVRFRNIWVREIQPAVGVRTGSPYNIQRKPRKPKPEPKATDEATEAPAAEKVDAGPEKADSQGEDKPGNQEATESGAGAASAETAPPISADGGN